jgi:hypothetical protein
MYKSPSYQPPASIAVQDQSEVHKIATVRFLHNTLDILQ